MKNKGFTIVDLVFAIALLGVFGAVVAPALIVAVKSYEVVSARRQVLAESRSGMDRMVREMRLIPGSSQILTTAATSFQFQYPAGTNITYALSGGNLLRNSDILIGNLNALSFTYYNELGQATSTPSQVRSVGVLLTVDAPGSVSNYTLRTRVFLTSTGNNYANFTSP